MAKSKKRLRVGDLLAGFQALPSAEQVVFVAMLPEEAIGNDSRILKGLDELEAIYRDGEKRQRDRLFDLRSALARARDATVWSDADLPTRWAKRFGVSLGTLKKWIRERKIIVDKVSARRWRFPNAKAQELTRT